MDEGQGPCALCLGERLGVCRPLIRYCPSIQGNSWRQGYRKTKRDRNKHKQTERPRGQELQREMGETWGGTERDTRREKQRE